MSEAVDFSPTLVCGEQAGGMFALRWRWLAVATAGALLLTLPTDEATPVLRKRPSSRHNHHEQKGGNSGSRPWQIWVSDWTTVMLEAIAQHKVRRWRWWW